MSEHESRPLFSRVASRLNPQHLHLRRPSSPVLLPPEQHEHRSARPGVKHFLTNLHVPQLPRPIPPDELPPLEARSNEHLHEPDHANFNLDPNDPYLADAGEAAIREAAEAARAAAETKREERERFVGGFLPGLVKGWKTVARPKNRVHETTTVEHQPELFEGPYLPRSDHPEFISTDYGQLEAGTLPTATTNQYSVYSPSSETVHESGSLDATTAVDHDLLDDTSSPQAVLAEIKPAPDYAKMDRPIPTLRSYVLRLQQALKDLRDLPWVSDSGRITADYFPGQTERHPLPRPKRGTILTWYKDDRQSLDLLSGSSVASPSPTFVYPNEAAFFVKNTSPSSVDLDAPVSYTSQPVLTRGVNNPVTISSPRKLLQPLPIRPTRANMPASLPAAPREYYRFPNGYTPYQPRPSLYGPPVHAVGTPVSRHASNSTSSS